jgi:hypothetical protein
MFSSRKLLFQEAQMFLSKQYRENQQRQAAGEVGKRAVSRGGKR